MNLRATLCFLMIFLCFHSAKACRTPSKAELRAFFRGKSQWVEVEERTARMVTRNTLRIHINFNQISKSRITKSRKTLGRISRVCKKGKSSLMVLSDKNHKIMVSKEGKKIKSHFFGTYYYLPKNEVKQANPKTIYVKQRTRMGIDQ